MYNQLSNILADYTGEILDIANSEVMPETGDKNQIVHQFEDGQVGVVDISDDSYFEVELQFNYISDADKNTILDLYHDSSKANGGENTFYWNHPRDDKTYVVRFLSPLKTVFVSGCLQSLDVIKLRVEGYNE